MTYYVDLDADEMAEDLWKDHAGTPGNTYGNTRGKPAPASRQKKARKSLSVNE